MWVVLYGVDMKHQAVFLRPATRGLICGYLLNLRHSCLTCPRGGVAYLNETDINKAIYFLYQP